MKYKHCISLTFAALLMSSVSLAQNQADYGALVPSQHETAKNQLRNKGFIEQLDRIPVSEYILDRMSQRVAEHQANGQQLSPDSLGFQALEEYNSDRAPFEYKDISEDVIHKNSDNYILPTANKITRIYTKTDFGTLLVEQSRGELVIDEPNISIVGYEAKIVITKQKGSKWSTTIYVGDEEYFYRIESNQRLSGNSRDNFEKFVEDLIQNG